MAKFGEQVYHRPTAGRKRQRNPKRKLTQREKMLCKGYALPLTPETCADCGHEPHEGACQEWVVNHTFGTGGLDKPCQCSTRTEVK